ncbi:hypothetical protein PR048_014564 [Dryococelus australis]|uniref:Uncharacterized protein n=1 Tax=Dryococelus australis TaxID=614101 RepID=A0ABQ9HEJ7_9NEOP|nr:hypothetical protein PR048_014564 [Dryococelus australis]
MNPFVRATESKEVVSYVLSVVALSCCHAVDTTSYSLEQYKRGRRGQMAGPRQENVYSLRPAVRYSPHFKLYFYSREPPPTLVDNVPALCAHDSHLRKPGVTRPGIELGSPRWEARSLTAQPPRLHSLVGNVGVVVDWPVGSRCTHILFSCTPFPVSCFRQRLTPSTANAITTNLRCDSCLFPLPFLRLFCFLLRVEDKVAASRIALEMRSLINRRLGGGAAQDDAKSRGKFPRRCAACAQTVSLLSSHQGDPGSIPGRVTPDFSRVGIVPDDTARRRVFSVFSFRRCSILTSPSSALKTSTTSTLRAAQISSLTHSPDWTPDKRGKARVNAPSLHIDPSPTISSPGSRYREVGCPHDCPRRLPEEVLLFVASRARIWGSTDVLRNPWITAWCVEDRLVAPSDTSLMCIYTCASEYVHLHMCGAFDVLGSESGYTMRALGTFSERFLATGERRAEPKATFTCQKYPLAAVASEGFLIPAPATRSAEVAGGMQHIAGVPQL